MRRSTRFRGQASPDERAETLREAIYVAFTLLAVLLIELTHPPLEPLILAGTVTVTVVALTCTMFAADVVSHLVSHDTAMNREQLRHATRAAFTPLLIAVVPVVALLLSGAGWWSAAMAVTLSVASIGIALGAVGWFAVRGLRSDWPRRFVLIVGLLGTVIAILGVQLLAHG
ncbi:hypothetical protein [Microbacterium sp.]|uniref:hypothetical protein n=1 Tax=Microbacterium sp. TaxID=51671 RepID=UPI0035678FB1